MEVLRGSPRTERAVGQTIYAYHDGYHHAAPQYEVLFEGAHVDEDLDMVPAARRLERTAELYLSKVPLTTDTGYVYQERLFLSIGRDGVYLTIEWTSEPYQRRIAWTHADPHRVRKSIEARLADQGGLTAHQRTVFRKEPARLLEKLVVIDDHLPMFKQIDAAERDDGTWLIELDPSADILPLHDHLEEF
jgi:hypothetical protein